MKFTTDPSATVTEALNTRITVREFTDKPVAAEVLTQLLETSLRSPSGGNLQPWKIHVMTGDLLATFKEKAAAQTLAGKMETPNYPPYPSPLWEPQRSWRYKLGEDMYALLGIPKEDKMKRLIWLAANARFFDAPVGIIITGNKDLGMPQYLDVGIYLQSLMLLAREAGLHTAPQGWWRSLTAVCHEMLDIPDNEEVLVGMSLGYGDPAANVNNLYADRASLEDVAKFYD